MNGIAAWKDSEVICESANGSMVYAQVDGEAVGSLPLTFRIVPNSLSLVTPAQNCCAEEEMFRSALSRQTWSQLLMR
jgi:hypothetical protein